MSSRKRMRLECDKSTAEALQPCATINDLPSEVMKNIFGYVGRGSYYFIGPVSKDFCYNYLTFDLIEDRFAHKLDFIQAIGRNKVTTTEAASTSMELAEHCFLYAPDKFQKELFRIVARAGRQDFVKMAVEISGVHIHRWIYEEDVEEITIKGDLGMLVLLKEKGLNIISFWRYHISKKAALHGHLDILQWLDQMKEKISSTVLFLFAAEGGHLNIIKWGINAGYSTFSKASCINQAVRSGNLELVKWFRNEHTSWNDTTSLSAVRSGNMEVLQYLLDNGCVFKSEAYNDAAQRLEKRKGLKLFKWLHQNNVPWNEHVSMYAASTGNLDALIYARTNDCPWDEHTIRTAVQNGQIDVVEYCLENDCPIGDINLCRYSMNNLHHVKALKVLQLLRKFDIPWNEETCEAAVSFGNLEALKWARNEGCPWDECTFGKAIRSNDMAQLFNIVSTIIVRLVKMHIQKL